MKKLKKVKFTTEKGETKELIFQPITEKLGTEEFACDKCCPYSQEVCAKLRNPRKESDPNSSFLEFCGELGLQEGDDPEIINYVPAEGTIENNLWDIKTVFDTLMVPNRFVRLSDVIDSVCQGSCPLYNKEHSRCVESNDMCILQDLIKKSNHGNNE